MNRHRQLHIYVTVIFIIIFLAEDKVLKTKQVHYY